MVSGSSIIRSLSSLSRSIQYPTVIEQTAFGRMPAKVPAFLLNRTLRFFSLRIVWVAAIVNVGATSYYLLCPGSSRSIALHFLLVTPPVAIAFLHLLEAFFGMPWLTYFLLELVEISCLVVILTGGYRASVSWQYQPTDFWLRISTYHILIVFISLLVLIRLAWLVDGWPRGANLLSRMDIRKKRYEGRSTSIKSSASIPDIEKVGRKKNFQSFLALSAEQLLNALDTDNSDILDNAFPDLLVVVDFAALDKAIEQAPTAVSQVSVRHHSVHVALALTDNVDEINEFIPVTLVPGMNLLGITDLIMRRRSTQPVLSTIGWPDLFNTSMAAELAYVVNDPHAALFDLPPGPNIATIRFSARNKATTWRVKQDAREKSVLSGLSSVGGLGSLLGTIFVFLFGSSLLGIMFGTKPLSPFGALHNFCSNIAERYQQRYTSMRTDIEKIYAERGVMKYLLDVLIDLDLIAKAIIVEDSGPGSDDFEIEVVSPVNEVESDNEVEDGARQ
ncbi:hypothetical protein MD484_g6430, partial [Candolleomyces efflorescens]